MDSTYGIEAGGRENGKDSKGKEAAWEENGTRNGMMKATNNDLRNGITNEELRRKDELRKRSGELKG